MQNELQLSRFVENVMTWLRAHDSSDKIHIKFL